MILYECQNLFLRQGSFKRFIQIVPSVSLVQFIHCLEILIIWVVLEWTKHPDKVLR
jgi:hypothetical protein